MKKLTKYAILVDASKCIACNACTTACKVKNRTPKGIFWTKVKIHEEGEFPDVKVVSMPWDRCKHCEEPACVTACPVGALRKTPEGPVIYDEAKCMGCRYCMMACPFGVPKLNWDARFPSIQKCTMCYDWIKVGLEPACVSVCPTEALKFGKREELLKEAKKRIQEGNGRYINHIYGEHEVGGTSLLYISPISFDKLKLREMKSEPVTEYNKKWIHVIPYALGGVLVGMSAAHLALKNKEEEKNEE